MARVWRLDRFYFVRRTFGTLFEISGAMQAIEKNTASQVFEEGDGTQQSRTMMRPYSSFVRNRSI